MHPFAATLRVVPLVLFLALAGCGAISGAAENVADAIGQGLLDAMNDSASFVHRTTAGNRSGHLTFIDHPYANGNPEAVLIVTPVLNPEGGSSVFNPYFVGVRYDAGRAQWAIQNLSGDPVNLDAAFNVTVGEGRSFRATNMAVHVAQPDNAFSSYTLINHNATNGRPDARVFVTQNQTPNGVEGPLNAEPIGVGYDASSGRWFIENMTGAPLPHGAGFNLAITDGVGGGTLALVSEVQAPGDISASHLYLDVATDLGDIVHVTPALNLGAGPYVYNNEVFAVFYDSGAGRWAVFNQFFTTPMTPHASFMVGIATP